MLDSRLVLIGDDLNFAQKFTRTAADGLSLIAEMDNPRAKAESTVVIDMMVTLQRGAKRLRARHIYSGAQNVLTALHHEDEKTLSGRIENLGSVVTEYARGLEELLQVPETRIQDVKTPKDKWETARETLNELLPKAPPETADILSRLMRAPVRPETVQPETIQSEPILQELDADILPFARAEKPALPEGSTEIKLAETLVDAFNLGPETQDSPVKTDISADNSISDSRVVVSLDAMMRDVVADALSVARSVKRTISLSYDMGERTISETRAENLRARLGRALSQIIRQSLSEDRIGHIDINLAGEQLHIVTGTTALRVAIDPDDIPAVKPLITTETEQGLRAQLNALMDPISIHETAS